MADVHLYQSPSAIGASFADRQGPARALQARDLQFRTDCQAPLLDLPETRSPRFPSTMSPTQVFLRGVNGRLSVVNASTAGEVQAAAGAGLRLVTGTRDLSCAASDATLASLGVESGATFTVLGRLLGGGKKRKKKTYTKPKKLKHKHKKVKMAVLKYYKIGDDGKVERLRRECPDENCGAGIFMAAHHDRVYCGKCGLTYIHEEGAKA